MDEPDEADAPVTIGGAAAKTSPSDDSRRGDAALRAAMASYQAGEVDGFHAVYAALAPALLRYLRFLSRRADLADDLLQETFLQIHRSRAAYDARYPVSPWVFGLARNVYLMHRRSAARFAAVHDTTVEAPDVPVPSDLDGLATRDLVQRAVARLDLERAEPLLLHHVWGFSFDEIAGMLGISAAAARARSSRAIQALRALLADGGNPR